MFRSIRIRLTAWYTAVLAVVLVAMAFGMYRLVDRVLERRADLALFEMSNTVLSASGRRSERLAETVRRFRAPDRRILLMTRDGQVIAQSDPTQFREFVDRRVFNFSPTDSALLAVVRQVPQFPGQPPRRFRDDRRLREERPPRLRGIAMIDGDAPVRVLARPLPREYPRDNVLVMIGSAREQTFILDMLRNALAVTTLVALVLAALPGYFLARRSLAPVSAMSRRAERIGAQNLDERLPVANPHDEIGRLARVLNDLLDRLQRAFEQQRRFMAEAAHELRTPVAVVRAESELALSKKDRSPDEYRDALGIVESESRRMSRIVDDLLTLSRVEAGQYPLRKMPVALTDIIARTARSLRVKADEHGVSIDIRDEGLTEIRRPPNLPEVTRASHPPMLHGDPDLLQRMLTNLLENAIRHARAGTAVTIETRWTAGPPGFNTAAVRIINYGDAIDESVRARIFEPFYRGDEERANAEAGAGLGLPIAQWIARAHGGDVRLVQADGNPAVFEVTLPPE